MRSALIAFGIVFLLGIVLGGYWLTNLVQVQGSKVGEVNLGVRKVPVLLFLWQKGVFTKGLIDRNQTPSEKLIRRIPGRIILSFSKGELERDLLFDNNGNLVTSIRDTFTENGSFYLQIAVGENFLASVTPQQVAGTISQKLLFTLYSLTSPFDNSEKYLEETTILWKKMEKAPFWRYPFVEIIEN